ncbi:MAG: Gfo/Idh/MocA family protein [Candidatus Odinarchaeia archaeon]
MKVAMIGCGAIAWRGHLPALKRIREIEVSAVVDSNENVAKKTAKKFGIKNYYNSIESVLKNNEINTVIIATPTPTHKELILQAANAGKNIIVEKPLATSLEEGLEIKEAVKSNNVKLTGVQNYRYYPAMLKARKIIKSGQLGGLTSIHGIGYTPWPTQWTKGTWLYYEPGVLLDFTPHIVDAILWITGCKPKKVYALGGDYTSHCKFINYAQISVEFHNKAISTIDVSWVTGIFQFTMSFTGTAGKLDVDPRYNTIFKMSGTPTPLDDVKQFMIRMKIIPEILSGRFFGVTRKLYDKFYQHLLDALKRNKRMPVPVEDALETLAILDGAYNSIKTGKAVDIKL